MRKLKAKILRFIGLNKPIKLTSEGEQEIVSIWAGSGIGSDPLKRISELIEENKQLKSEIHKLINDNQKK